MTKESMLATERNSSSKGMILGGISGGLFGAVVGWMHTQGFLNIYGMQYIFSAVPLDGAITGAILGIFIGLGIGRIRISSMPAKKMIEDKTPVNNAVLQLREEQLDISKKRVKTGEVTTRKEVIQEEKTITVPITREELVIARKVFDGETTEREKENTEMLRIPIREERIEVVKHPVELEQVDIHRHEIQQNERVEETLKKEKLHVETMGNAKVINMKERNRSAKE